MPLYDFRCPEGHSAERFASFAVSEIACPACGLPARRSSVNRISFGGFADVPFREHRVNLTRAVEAQHELVYQAEKHHVELPDFLGEARRKAALISAAGVT